MAEVEAIKKIPDSPVTPVVLLESFEALEQAVLYFEAQLVVVAHDVHLLRVDVEADSIASVELDDRVGLDQPIGVGVEAALAQSVRQPLERCDRVSSTVWSAARRTACACCSW